MSLPEASRKHVIALSFYGRSISEIQNLLGIILDFSGFKLCSEDSKPFLSAPSRNTRPLLTLLNSHRVLCIKGNGRKLDFGFESSFRNPLFRALAIDDP